MMAKSHSKENGKDREDNESVLLLGQKPLSANNAGSPTIHFRPEFVYEAFEMNSSFSAAVLNSSGSSANLPSLRQAIRERNLAYVRQYSQTGHDLNAVDGTGFTLLHHAASGNNVEVVSMLLNCHANVNCQGQQLLTPLHVAVRYNSVETIKTLMGSNADPSIRNSDGATPLHFAARRGCVDISKLLLSSVLTSVNCPDHSGMTPFHLACISGSSELCEMFMGHKADIYLLTVEEKSPLHLAALHGNKAIAEMLIKKALQDRDNPIDYIHAPDFERNTPLHLSCQKGHVETVNVLVEYGADVIDGEKEWDQHSPLHLAAANGHMTVVEVLISHNAPVDCRDELQRTPLHRAAEFDRVDVVKYLLKVGADIEAKDNANRTAFICAVRRGRTRTSEVLLESGAKFESRDESLRTCIHHAVQHEREETLRMLLERDQGKLIKERDKDLQTPLHYAARLGFLKILQILLEKTSMVAPIDVVARTPLHAAAVKGHVDCAEELCLSDPGHVNDKDERGLTALHLAAREGHRETCSLLLHMGAHTMVRDSNRWTTFHHCAAGGCVRTTKALLAYHSTLQLEATDQDGNTPLHIAARCGNVGIVELMLSRGADVTVFNKQMMTCLDVAIEYGKEKVAEVLIKNDQWKEILRCKAEFGINPMKSLIQTMPRLAEEVMNKCVTYSDLSPHDPEYSVTFDFSFLAPCDNKGEDESKTEGSGFFGPATMVECEREDLLMHPLSQALLQWKWNTVGKPLFWCNFLTYFAFVCLLNVFVVTERKKQLVLSSKFENSSSEDEKIFRFKSTFSSGAPVIIAIFICIHMLKEIYQIIVQQWRYFTHFTNLTEWCCYLSALCYIASYFQGRNIFSNSMALWPLASIVILLSYLSLVLFLRRFSFFGIYVSMFFEVSKTFLRVALIFTPIIFAFSMAFFLLLKEQDAFNTIWWSLLKTFIMMVGEIDYGSIIVDSKDILSEGTGAPLVPIPHFTAIVVFLFCMLISVLLMNLLVGLAVGDIDSIQRDANMRRLATQVEFVTDIDQRYPRFLRKHLDKSVLVIKPNQRNKLAVVIFNMSVDLFPNSESSTDGGRNNGAEDDQPTESKVSSELSKQREQIKRLQDVVEDQSRLLQEIFHHLKQVERPVDTGKSSGQNVMITDL